MSKHWDCQKDWGRLLDTFPWDEFYQWLKKKTDLEAQQRDDSIKLN